MKKRLFAFFFIIMSLIATGFFMLSSPIPPLNEPAVPDNQTTTETNSPIRNTELKPHAIETKAPSDKQNNIESLHLSTQSQMIANAYAKEITFPPYSKPLSSKDTGLLKPNRFAPVSLPLENGETLSLKLTKFRFIFPEPIQFSLHSSNSSHLSATVELINSATSNTLLTQPLAFIEGNAQATVEGKEDWPTELVLKVTINSLSSKQPITALFQYVSPVAQVISIEDRYPDEADVVIPVSIDVTKAGLYRLRANLYSLTNQPIAILTGEEKLSQGIQSLPLRIHKSVLGTNEGPYQLTTFQLEKMSASPSELTEYGTSLQESYAVESLALSLLADEPYHPTENELKRLQFLEKMAESP